MRFIHAWYRYRTVLIAFLVGLWLTLGAAPGITQSPLPTLAQGEQRVQQGRTDFAAGRYERAAQALTEAIVIFETQMHWSALAATLTNLGRVQFANGDTNAALASWERAADTYSNQLKDRAGILRSQLYQARALQDLGLYAQACQTITQAIATNPQFCTNHVLTADNIPPLPTSLDSQPELTLQGWQSFGDILRVMGRLDESRQVLEALVNGSIPIRTQEAVILSLGNTLTSLGDRSRDRTLPQKFDYLPWRCQPNQSLPAAAQNFYQQANHQYRRLTNSETATIRTKARLNQFRLISEGLISERLISEEPIPGSPNTTIQSIDVTSLPSDRTRIYARIQVAKSQVCLHQQHTTLPNWSQLTQAVEHALTEANSLQDRRAQSYVLGNLAGLYEYRAWWTELKATANPESKAAPKETIQAAVKADLTSWRHTALTLTDQALYLTQPSEFADLAYQWQWQRGRLLNAEGDQSAAITAYEAAIQTLEAVRGDLLAINSDVQFSFRDDVEPVYRELVALLLPAPGNQQASEPENQLAQTRLQQVLGDSLYYVESLQLAELENFLQCNVETLGTIGRERLSEQSNPPAALIDRIDQLFQQDPSTGLIYPILLNDRIALIFKRPGGAFEYHTTLVDHETVETTLNQLQAYLRDPSRTNAIRDLSSQVYQWLIAPFEAELEADTQRDVSTLKNLVFVLDGSLRNIPMAMLYDQQRQRYLLERYSIAISSGLQLLDASHQASPIQALVGGLSEARQFGDRTFSALSNVPAELNSIQTVLPSENLLNSEFNRSNLRSQLGSKAYSVVHMATHGNFSSNPEDTFLVLSDQRLQASELNDLLRSPEQSSLIELLVLSACETATGDKRAALGLAGLALRAGARSTLATLWQVNDASTAALMREFYAILHNNPDTTKADALRQAQLSLWKDTSQDWQVPFFWAPYVLVGNWL